MALSDTKLRHVCYSLWFTQSLLINGRGMFNCSLAPGGACNASRPDCTLPPLFTAVPGKTYLLRIGSLTSLSSLNFEIEVPFVNMSTTFLS